MEYIVAKIGIHGAKATVLESNDITRGLTGAKVQLIYDDDLWSGLRKEITFKGVSPVTPIITDETLVELPQQVTLAKNMPVSIGVTGINAKGTIQIPTVWATIGTVKDSGYGDYPLPAAPLKPEWAQVVAMIGTLSNLNTEARENLVEAINEVLGKAGTGGGNLDLSGYVKSVNGVTPDKDGNVKITIPDSSQNLAVDTTLTQSGQAADAAATGARLTALELLGGITTMEPAEDDIPKLYIKGTLPTSKADEDVQVVVRYISKTMDFKCPATLKVQGHSSTVYPKKNFTMKLYKDSAYESKKKVAFKNWGEMNKFVLKAHWVDHSHVRNVGASKIFGAMVRSRSDFDTLPEELRTAPNNGATDGFTIKVIGKGGHSSMPEQCIDPVTTGAQIIMALQNIKSRLVAASETLVFSVCKVHCGDAYNIIPGEMMIEGSVRSFSKEVRERLPQLISQIASGICAANGAQAECVYEKGYASVINDEALTDEARDVLNQLFGKESILEIGLLMPGEDFSAFTELTGVP